jgi:hypothetical protein
MRVGASSRGTMWVSGGLFTWLFMLPVMMMWWMALGSWWLFKLVYWYPVRAGWRAYQRRARVV